MLVSFSIDPEAIPMAATQPGPRRHCHERFLKQWLTRGVLVFAGRDRDESSIVAKVNSLPQELRKLWKTALKKGRSIPGPEDWNGLERLECLDDLRPLQNVVQLACLETVRYCSALNLEETSDETCRCLADPSIEVARFDCADRAQSFIQSEAISSAGIPIGESLASLWATRFAKLAAVSQHGIIVDRYALQGGDNISGLERFLIELNRCSRSTSVTLYAGCQIEKPDGTMETPNDLTTKVRQIVPKLGQGGIRSIDVSLVPNKNFTRDSHGRYVRFDSSVIEIDLGISLFFADDAGRTWRRCQFAFKRAEKFHYDTENDLRSHRESGSPWSVL